MGYCKSAPGNAELYGGVSARRKRIMGDFQLQEGRLVYYATLGWISWGLATHPR